VAPAAAYHAIAPQAPPYIYISIYMLICKYTHTHTYIYTGIGIGVGVEVGLTQFISRYTTHEFIF